MIGGVAHRFTGLAAAALVAAMLAGCVTPYRPTPAPQPHYKVGQPYKVNGHWYYPHEDPDYEAIGLASWYGPEFNGKRTANGEIFDMNRLSAAHTTLPLPSLVEVENLENGRRAIVRVNDRGPFVKDRLIDVSRAAARELGFESKGVARVKVRYLGRARLASAAAAKPGAAGLEKQNVILAAIAAAAEQDGASADPISRIIAASDTEEFTAGARAFVLAEAEAAIRGETPPPPDQTAAPPDASPAQTEATARASQSAPETGADARLIAEAAPGPTATNALYAVQIAVFANLNNLEAAKLALSDLGTVRVARLERPSGPLYRIRLGPFSTRQAAAERLAAVREAGYGDAQIITIAP